MSNDRAADPTRVRNQDAVQRPDRRVWIAVSGFLALIAIVLFAFSIPIVAAWAWIGIAVQAAIFLAVLVSGFTGRRTAAQGSLFAMLVIVQAVVALLVTVIIAIAAWAPVG